MGQSATTFALVAILVSGCVGSIDDTAPYVDAAVCPDDFQAAILAPRCGLAGCHVPFEPAGGLDLVSPDLHLRLVDRTATTCGDRRLVTSGAPEESFLITRLSPNPTCGEAQIDRMPLTGDYLTDAELACARAFVARLAEGHDAP